jgi:hypothetical protein
VLLSGECLQGPIRGHQPETGPCLPPPAPFISLLHFLGPLHHRTQYVLPRARTCCEQPPTPPCVGGPEHHLSHICRILDSEPPQPTVPNEYLSVAAQLAVSSRWQGLTASHTQGLCPRECSGRNLDGSHCRTPGRCLCVLEHSEENALSLVSQQKEAGEIN